MITERSRTPGQSDADAYDAALDHMVDTRGISYGEARRELGEPPYELYETPQTAVARPMGRTASRNVVPRRPRRRSGHGPQFGEEEGVGYPGGEPHYYQPHEPLSDEQAEINRRGIATAHEVLEAKRREKTEGEQ